MNLISWNCRGLGSLRAVQELTKMVKKFRLYIVFLCETKRKATEIEIIRVKLFVNNPRELGFSPGPNFHDLSRKVSACGKALLQWNRTDFGHVGHFIKLKQKKLNGFLAGAKNEEVKEEIDRYRKELNALLYKEETMWCQREKTT
ncbi:hypothetical protein DITRI_Ditri04bG0112200 [Diplodiscus trichospermus]